MSDTESRLADLRELRDGLKGRMETTTSDQNYAVMGRLLVQVVAEIEELAGADPAAGEGTGLSEFERKLAERTGSKAKGRAKSG